MANVQMKGGPGVQVDVDFDDLPPPPPEMLQQQYLYGTVPDSRQQALYNQQAYPKGQGVAGFTPGAGEVTMPPPQKAGVSNIPPSSTPIQVEKRSMGQAPPAAPETFKLIPVKTEQEKSPPPAPVAVTHQKPSLEAMDQQVLNTVDDHAIQVRKTLH